MYISINSLDSTGIITRSVIGSPTISVVGVFSLHNVKTLRSHRLKILFGRNFYDLSKSGRNFGCKTGASTSQ